MVSAAAAILAGGAMAIVNFFFNIGARHRFMSRGARHQPRAGLVLGVAA